MTDNRNLVRGSLWFQFVYLICIWISVVPAFGQWLNLEQVKLLPENSELGGTFASIEYDLKDSNVSVNNPAYVFVRCSNDGGQSWKLLSPEFIRGKGVGIVNSPGHKTLVWWGPEEAIGTDLEKALIRVRAFRMCRVPAGRFEMKSISGQGRDEFSTRKQEERLPRFYIAVNETTIGMYVDYLNEKGRNGSGWNERMSRPDRCGIVRSKDGSYTIVEGRENYPVTYVSWYDAVAFLQWCGLRLPSEAEFEKAIRGGLYLDGEQLKMEENPNPQRRFPWGDESPGAGGVYHCNFEGKKDGFEFTSPVGSFLDFCSPYGACDLAGNVSEWTVDWYTTSYHVGLDGFRVVRGGSWMDVPAAVDAVSGATQFPIKESSIMGFRGVYP